MDRIERYQTAYKSAYLVPTSGAGSYSKGTEFALPKKGGKYPSGVLVSPKNRNNSANTLSLVMFDDSVLTFKISGSNTRDPYIMPLEVKAIAASNTVDGDSLEFLYQF